MQSGRSGHGVGEDRNDRRAFRRASDKPAHRIPVFLTDEPQTSRHPLFITHAEASMTHVVQPQVTSAQPRTDVLTDVVWEGLIAGLIGYATVAVLVGVIDVAQGRSFFFTAAMLGESLFYGLTDPAKVVVWPGAVFAYNGMHLLGFLFIGMCAAWLAYMAEKGPELWYVGVIALFLVVLHAYGAVLLMTEGLRSALPDWMVLVPTVAGIAAMLVYLLIARPGLRKELTTWRN
jgi:hypothetical protein